MIKSNYEGYYFISNSGIKYDLYEGVTFGGNRQYTSDAIFIMLSDEEYFDRVKTPLVDFWMGVTFFEDAINEFDEDINELVTNYEKENGIYKGEVV